MNATLVFNYDESELNRISESNLRLFKSSNGIEFTLAEDGFPTLKVYDMLGREASTLVNKELKAGVMHKVQFNASGMTSGIYFIRLESGKSVLVEKLLLTK